VNAIRRPVFVVALAVLMPLFAQPATMQAQQHSMSGMNHIMVPEGAAYTVADVEFMQGMIAHHAQASVKRRATSSPKTSLPDL